MLDSNETGSTKINSTKRDVNILALKCNNKYAIAALLKADSYVTIVHLGKKLKGHI